MRTIAPVSPGDMLEEEFLKPLGLTKYRLAKDALREMLATIRPLVTQPRPRRVAA